MAAMTDNSMAVMTLKPTTKTTPKKKKTTFFSLPGELRNVIYRLALVEKGCFSLSPSRFRKLHHAKYLPPLLYSTPQAAAESSSIYWLENLFCFEQDTLSDEYIDEFESILDTHARNLTKVGVRRHFTVGDMKPIQIRFMVEIKNNRIIIVRPAGEERPFPGVPGFAKFRSEYTEPCRCDVRRVAYNVTQGVKRVAGHHLLHFMSEYVRLVRTPAKNVHFEWCNACQSARRR